MPKVAKELSSIEVKRLGHPGQGGNNLVAVGGVAGLALQITPTGAKSWILRSTIGGKRRSLGLGSYPSVTLAMARERAREALDKIHRGVDPIEERKRIRAELAAAQARGLTFEKAAEKFLASKTAEFRNPKHAAQWESTLRAYAYPLVGDLPVDAIEVGDVLRVLQQDVRDKDGKVEGTLWSARTETASRLRGRIESVLNWAAVSGHRSGENVARWKGNLDAILPKPGKIARVEHQGALALTDVPAWFAALREREGMAARALQFLAMTAARSGEVRGMAWSEVDLDAGLWTIPASRMKAGREHRVPLTSEAVALLKGLPRMKDSDFVFWAPRGGALSDMTLSAVMRRMQADAEKAGEPGWLDPRSGRPAVPHGLRSSFRDWSAERTEFPREMAELALAHNVGSEVERAYRRSDMVERRRQMMRAWAAFLRGEAGEKVVKLGRRG